jgi:parvulin-like peptidyl-prolyl isomerase
MKPVVLYLCAAALLPAWQTPPPGKTLAHVDSEAITAAKLTELLTGAPTLALNSAHSDPVEFLTWTYLLQKMSAEAVKQGLSKKSPYADRIDWNRSQVLMMARIEEKNREAAPDDQELQTLYRENPHRYGTAKTKLIFIPAGPTAKATMDNVAAQARKGVDFVKLVKQYSADQDSVAKDGNFADIGPESRIPEAIRKAIFTTKPGELTQVFSQPAGFYLFKVTAVNMRPLEEIAQETRTKTSQDRAGEWMAAEKKKATVKIIHEEFFRSLRVTAGPMVSRGAETINFQATPQTAEIKPETVLAEINGKPMNAADYTNLIKALSPQVRTKAIVEPTGFLRDYAFMLNLVDDAQRIGLDKKQPYKNRLAYDRDMALMQAAVDEYLNNIAITLEDQKAGYTADPNKFRFANTRVLYVAYSLTPPPQTDPNARKVLTEPEAKAKIDGILAEYLEKKGDFAAFVQRYSEDEASRQEGGVMRPISFLDPQVPDHIKGPIFAAKPGDVVGPVKMPNGFYLFKVDAFDVKKYEDVKDQIYEELRQQRFQEWFNQQRASFKVTIDDPEGFRQVVASLAH